MTRSIHSLRCARRGARPLVRSLLIVLLLAATIAPACANLERIDRDIDRLVQARSDYLDGGAVAPPIWTRPRSVGSVGRPYDTRPDTRNPAADQIEYSGAPNDRDVVSRLETYAAVPAGARSLDLEKVFGVAQATGREFLTAEEDYLLAAIRLLIERHLWGPRLFDELSVAFAGQRVGGSYQSTLNVINELRVTQRLPYGGEVEARLITQASRQLSAIVGDAYIQSSQLVLAANIPLLRNAGKIAREDLIQAKRDLVYAARDFEAFRRSFLVSIARDYFGLIARQATINNQEDRLQSLIVFRQQTEALVEAGREAPFQARNVEQNVLTSRNALINSREQFILAMDRFKIRLGLPIGTPLTLQPVAIEMQDPDVTVGQAALLALDYRLDLQNETDRLDDSRRAVANARNQLLPDLRINADTTLRTNPSQQVGGLDLDLDQTSYNAGITFGLPLDREIERLQLRQSLINLARQKRNLDQFRDNVILDARAAVREIDRARFSLRLQNQAVQINDRRLEEIRIKADTATPQERLDAENELLQARNDGDAAIRDLRTAVLDYLRLTGLMRVTPDGQIQPLAGMVYRVLEPDQPDALDQPEGEPGPEPPADGAGPAPDPEAGDGGS